MTLDTRTKRFILLGLILSVVVAVVVSQFASSSPDGLEYVADNQGFTDTADDHAFADSPLADYGSGVTDTDWVGTAVAGLVGVAVTFGVVYGLFWITRRRNPKAST